MYKEWQSFGKEGHALKGERRMRRGVRFGLSNGDPISESRPTGDSEYGESTRAPAVGVSASPALKRNIFFAGLHAMQSHQLEARRHVKPSSVSAGKLKEKARSSLHFMHFLVICTFHNYHDLQRWPE